MYIEHFGLSGQPFQLTPDARFWFASRTHRKAMAYLGYGLAQGEGFIVVTGEIGAGKSTLVAHLLETIDRQRLNAIGLVSTQVEGDDMLRLAAQGLGVDVAGVEKARLLDLVERRLEEEARAGKRTLLIVDEAQNLPVSALEELRMLSNFQVAGRPLIQIFLLGQPEFADKLAAPGLEQLRQRVIASHHLEAMGPDEVESYVRHRLERVGWTGRPAFDAGAFAALHKLTDGIPRRINQLANRLMLHAAVDGLETVDQAVVEAVAEDLRADARSAPVAEPVLPLRPVRAAPEAANEAAPRETPGPALEAGSASATHAAPDPRWEAAIAALEARAAEQERMLRQVLTLLVDWVEGDAPEAYRTHAA